MSTLLPLPAIQYADLPNGERLAYREFNPAAPHTLVLVHGNASNHLAWREFIEHPKMQDHRILTVDVRGFGWSSYNRPVDSHVEYGGDIGLLAQKLGLSNVRFMGWSTGGAIVMQMAADYPETASALYLVDSVPFSGLAWPKFGPDGQPLVPLQLVSSREDLGQFAAMAAVLTQGTSEQVYALFKTFFVDEAQPPLDSPRWAELLQALRQQRNALEIAWANVSFNITPDPNPAGPGSGALSRIRCPMFVIHGRREHVVPFAQMQQCVEKYGGARTTLIPHSAGHMPPFECLDEFVGCYRQTL